MNPTPDPFYPLGEQLPDAGEVLPLTPDVAWVRMPLPFALDHINLWLLRDRAEDGTEGWAIVDAGIHSEATRKAWGHIFATGLAGLPVLRVIVTHMHPDHIGLADWLCEQWHTPERECRLWISATDWNVARGARLVQGGFGGARTADFHVRHGITDTHWLADLRERPNHYARMVPSLPARYRRLMDRQRLRIGQHDWFCIAGYGHAPEHMALHCPELDLLISGDMVLPRISTNISVIDLEPEADPLTLYLRSLDDIAARVPDSALVLPSHGRPFKGLHARITALHQHHADRLSEMHAACAEKGPQTAAELMPVLFPRTLDAQQIGFALGETIAHANCLWLQGRLRPRQGQDGRLRFEAL